jgi:hypothetical protein
MASKEKSVHHLINRIRRKRGLRGAKWSRKMAHLAQSQAKYCARVGKLVHSDRPALKGGENLCGGSGNMSARTIVKCWMTSKAGHREWLLDSRVKLAGVGIVKSKHGTYAAWAFSDQPLSLPGKMKLPKLKIPSIFSLHFFKNHKTNGGVGVLRLPVKIILLFASIVSIVLGVHGLWVYFSSLEYLLGGKGDKLFLEIGVGHRLGTMVQWMSMKGFQSWFIPAVFIILGIVLWGVQSNIYAGNKFGWLKKLHLW